MQRGLLGLVAIGDEAGEQMDEEIERTAMARVLDLADVLELIDDRLDQGAFAQEELVGGVEETGVHVLAERGDEDEALFHEELPSERR